jgi:hypothetical protein
MTSSKKAVKQLFIIEDARQYIVWAFMSDEGVDDTEICMKSVDCRWCVQARYHVPASLFALRSYTLKIR